MKSADQIRAVLRDNRITHVFVNWSEILRYRLTYGYTAYVYPDRFQQLTNAGILQPPEILGAGNYDSLSEQEQQEVRSWKGGASLCDGPRWNTYLLYRVSP